MLCKIHVRVCTRCAYLCAHVCASLCVHACAHTCMSVHIRYPLPDLCSIRVSMCVCTGTDSVPRYSEWVNPSHWRESWADLYPGAAIYQPCFLSKFCCFSESQFFTYSVVCLILTTKGTVVFSHFAILAIKLNRLYSHKIWLCWRLFNKICLPNNRLWYLSVETALMKDELPWLILIATP